MVNQNLFSSDGHMSSSGLKEDCVCDVTECDRIKVNLVTWSRDFQKKNYYTKIANLYISNLLNNQEKSKKYNMLKYWIKFLQPMLYHWGYYWESIGIIH